MLSRIPPALIVLLLIACPQIALADETGIEAMFTDDEIAIIHEYFLGQEALPEYGKRRNKGLPPGIARNLQRGKSLPPGIAKQYLPQDLQSSLPAPPKGYERVIIDGKVLLIEIATQVVRDVLTDIAIG